MMRIKAIDLFNNLKEYTEEDLKKLNVVVEIGRNDERNEFGVSEYANGIENYESQIRIINKIN